MLINEADECAAPSPKQKQVTFGDQGKPLSQHNGSGILKNKERNSIKSLNLQNNKENTPVNTSHIINTSNVSLNTSFNTINTSTTTVNTPITRKPSSKRAERPTVTSVEALFAKNKAAPTTTILRSTPTRDNFNRKVKTNKPVTQPYHPYQRPTDKANTSRSTPPPNEDHTWLEKQEAGFEKWLNFVFSPYYDDEDVLKTTNIISGAGALSYKELACQRRQSLLRLDVLKLMQTEDYKKMISKIDAVCQELMFNEKQILIQ